MRDGMLAKSYAVAMMDMRRTELCLGADAIRCQLEQSRKELEELQVVQRVDKEHFHRLSNTVMRSRRSTGTADTTISARHMG